MRTILEVKNLNRIYEMGNHNAQHVLKDISLKIGRGEFVTIMGQSGSGKSTLLANVSGMDRPTSGSVQFEREELTVMKEEPLAALRLRRMGFVFQQGNLMKNLNIIDNIMLASCLAGTESKRVIKKRAKDLMRNTGIAELAEHDITQVSGGQMQRAAICRALMNNPAILFADEPTGALNTAATGEVLDILTAAGAAGTTILLVTHDAKVAARSERVLFMTDGCITAEQQVGRYEIGKSDISKREAELDEWLRAQGF